MLSAIIKARTAFAACCLWSAMVLVAGCQSTDLGIDSGPATAGQAVPTPNPAGEVHGTSGKTRITMMLPRSAAGNGAVVANEVRNGALLAMKDFGNADMELVIKDDTGQAAGAQAAASEAVREGSTAILGPVFAANVTAAAGITLPAGRTMIAFSTDTSNARRGVYLLSYTPQEDTKRIVEFTLSRGSRSIIAFLPSNAEGSVRETVLRQVAGTAGASVQVIRYERSAASIEEAVKGSAAMMATVDTIYIPEGGEIPNAIALMFRRNTIDIVGKQILGSGAWEASSSRKPSSRAHSIPDATFRASPISRRAIRQPTATSRTSGQRSAMIP